jgi:hypothetical protein
LTALVAAVVAAGVALAIALGLAAGFDLLAVLLLAFIAIFGALGVVVARRAQTGMVVPARCSECGGLVSPNAPYCKHCGASP